MLLSPGTQLRAYVIEALIGSGGMGEVYKAHDVRLNRPVAIKRMLDGFEREARATVLFIMALSCRWTDSSSQPWRLHRSVARLL